MKRSNIRKGLVAAAVAVALSANPYTAKAIDGIAEDIRNDSRVYEGTSLVERINRGEIEKGIAFAAPVVMLGALGVLSYRGRRRRDGEDYGNIL